MVSLWGAGPAAASSEASAEEMLRLMESGCGGALRVLRALVDAGVPQAPRLWLVTRGAQVPAVDAPPSAVAQSALWGLGRTMALEHPELKVSLVDVGGGSTADEEVALMSGELLGTGEGDQVSLRAGERRVARLTRGRRLDVPASPISFSAEATYLITGGLGGIGLKLARWMAERGARHLALLGRGGPSEAARAVLGELEAGGVEVLLARADVADREQLAAALEEISARMPPLRGVVHAALVLDDGVLLKQEWESFRRVLSPKAAGAWNLHLLTRETPLDFFVLFSSVLSLLGGSGQGNYTAASAFVDALAQQRRAAGLPALSINWGPWAYEGSAAAEVIEQHSQLYDGFTGISPPRGLEALGRLLQTELGQVGVMPFDWRQWGELYPAAGATLLSGLMAAEAPAPGSARRAKEEARLTREALTAAEAPERERMLRDYLHGIVARRLGVSPSAFGADATFISLGLDSLMTLELRNRIVEDLGLSVPPVKFIENPTVSRLGAALHERWVETHAPAAQEPPQEELLARVALLSDEEVEASLRDLLASTGQQ